MMGFLFYTTIVLFIFVCFCMILLILIQKGRGGGLASAFGGSGGNTAFGSKTGDVLTWATSIVFGVFLLLAVALNLITNRANASNAPIVVNPTTMPTQAPAGTEPEMPAEAPATPTPAPAPAPAPAAPSTNP